MKDVKYRECVNNCKEDGPLGPIWCTQCGHSPQCCNCDYHEEKMAQFKSIWDSEKGNCYECIVCNEIVKNLADMYAHHCKEEQDNAADSEEDDADDTPLFIDWNPKSSSPGESTQQ